MAINMAINMAIFNRPVSRSDSPCLKVLSALRRTRCWRLERDDPQLPIRAEQRGVSGALRLMNTAITGNSSDIGASGLRVHGGMQSCALAATTTICANAHRNVDGPYFLEGAATVCNWQADLTGNGRVDARGLSVLLSSWSGCN